MERTQHTFGGGLLSRFIDYETDEGAGGGDHGPIPTETPAEAEPAAEAGAAPATPLDTGAAPEAEGAPSSSGEPEAPTWAGPTQEEWQQFQEQQRQMVEAWNAAQQTAGQDTAGEGPSDDELVDILENARLEGDTRTEVAVLQEINRRAVRAELGPATPAIQAAMEQQQEQLAKSWLTQLNVPEPDWEDVALLGSGYRSLTPDVDGRQAAQVAYQRLQERDQRIRADERQKIAAEQQAEQERLRQLASAPNTPTGPGGVEEPYREDEDEVAGWRRFKERQAAAQ